jgi:hypothetical protein
MSNTDFEAQLEYGRRAEELVDYFLQADGAVVLRSSDFTGPGTGSAPRLHGQAGEPIIPDRQAFKDGGGRWAEVKRKKSATHHHISDEWEHGFARRLWLEYIDVEVRTGIPVDVFVYEDNTGCLLRAVLGELEPRVYDGQKMGRGGMVFFRRSMFTHCLYEPALRTKFGLPEPSDEWIQFWDGTWGPCPIEQVDLAYEYKRERDWEEFMAQATAADFDFLDEP